MQLHNHNSICHILKLKYIPRRREYDGGQQLARAEDQYQVLSGFKALNIRFSKLQISGFIRFLKFSFISLWEAGKTIIWVLFVETLQLSGRILLVSSHVIVFQNVHSKSEISRQRGNFIFIVVESGQNSLKTNKIYIQVMKFHARKEIFDL